MSTKFYFKEGDEVAHKDNLGVKLTVQRIIKEFKTIRSEKASSTLIERRCMLKGIECGWWGPDKQYYKNVFHSTSLIPFEVAEEGFVAVEKYLIDRATANMERKK